MIYPMIGSFDLVFHVTYNGIKPFKYREIWRIVSTSGFDRVMKVSDILKAFKTSKTIGNNYGAGFQMLLAHPEHF